MTLLGFLALGVRLLVAGVVLFSLFFKVSLISVREYRFPGWIPKWMSKRTFNWFYGVGVVLEAAAFYLFVNIASNKVIGAGVILMLGLVFTGYGLISLHKVGDCGCAGVDSIGLAHNSSKAASLLVRNTLLFGGGAGALLLSPSVDQIDAALHSGASIQALSLVALSFLALYSVLLFRSLRLR